MDLESFGSLYESSQRLAGQEKAEAAQTAQLAAQATGRSLMQYIDTKRWLTQDNAPDNDAAAFHARLSGIGKVGGF